MATVGKRTCSLLLGISLNIVGLVLANSKGNAPTNFLIGAGIGDITGPAAEVNLMGYANPSQTSNGIHMRQYSRAFVFANSDNKTRTVFVSTDSCMISQDVKLEVVKRLRSEFGSLYTERNLCISGIHTHSGPAGFHQYLLFEITSLGFVNQSFVALVDGIVDSVRMAHKSVRPGNIYINSGELLESNINRSPSSYLNNPEEERKKYTYNVDKNMTVLKMVDTDGKGIGMISWFAVHCTSMNNTNGLISSDNKGYASQMFEGMMNPGALPGKGPFVAAFAQSNEGDVSPNTKGPHCIDTGGPCDILHSTCHNKNELCIASGPGRDMFESTKIIGENQYKKAMELYNSANIPLTGPVDFRHTYVDMTAVDVNFNSTTKVKTCKPAMGYSFAAGTTDGPGAFNFEQGSNSSNPLWNIIRDFIKTPTKEQEACHHPKPILLDTGEITFPYAWQPSIVDTQILRVGQLVIIAVPAEFTTMSGRRTRDAVKATLVSGGFPADTVPVIAGLSNDYADYVTTFEEYQIQRYEGASTIYGPHTLTAYIQKFVELAGYLAKGTPSPPGPNPPNLLSSQLSLLPPVVFDTAGFKNYGDVIVDVQKLYKQNSTVMVTFVSADPRNKLMRDATFLTVEKQANATEWEVVFTDAGWNTRFHWYRMSLIEGTSKAEIRWDIPANQEPGTYRIKHFGNHKNIIGEITAFDGTSSSFQVIPSDGSKVFSKEQIEDVINSILDKGV